MIPLGKQKAVIVNAYIGANDNNTPYVGIRLRPAGEEETCTAKVYLSAKALFFAARTLLACGFDIKVTPLEEIEIHPELLTGKEVEIIVAEETYNGHNFQKVDIVVPQATVDKSRLSALTDGMRSAVTKSDAPKEAKKETPKKPLTAPADRMKAPAVQHIPPAERARLDKQAEEEGIGF